ncbi:Pimeloyl-ACP methyl ester carboxylesterase [Mesobacillus persicus]|uniref:Pimeloyl-ACP methyl ester carboxylesterase n=1 Tax=Mesobacillus persicus TaxID=930146 RepID=A0A1H8IP65_9BACI|nr:alpha/beta hydrolase [Mesobacillus persicus]SEN70710.1 Pimeloyl-ACP methyl ester carboxylesterase [Mesobacillus persicus]
MKRKITTNRTTHSIFSDVDFEPKSPTDKDPSINLAEFVEINGIEQFLYHAGDKTENQVILHLHGGPGNAFSNKAYLLKEWNSSFTMVYWDQRGAGKTALKNPDAVPTFANMLEDIHEIILYLKRKYHKQKIGLFAHSWGTIIGSIFANQHPDDVEFYIGVGQVIAPVQNEIVGYQETLRRLKENGDTEGLKQLEVLGDYPGDKPEEMLTKMSVVREWQGKLGMTKFDPQEHLDQIKQSPLFHPDDLKAQNVSAKLLTGLFIEMFHYSLYDYPLTYEVPVYYILGKDDWQVPSILGIEYLKQITAPEKQLLLIKDSMHSPMLEKPTEFLHALRKIIGDGSLASF